MTAIAYAPRPGLATRFATGRRESRRRRVAILAERTKNPKNLDRRLACREIVICVRYTRADSQRKVLEG